MDVLLGRDVFFFLLLLLFSVLFCRKVMAQQWSVLSGFTQLHTASLPSSVCVCVCALETCAQLNMYYMNITKHCVCVHACVCVCAWACLYLVPLCLTHCFCNPPYPPLLIGAKVLQSGETFLEAIIGVMRSG